MELGTFVAVPWLAGAAGRSAVTVCGARKLIPPAPATYGPLTGCAAATADAISPMPLSTTKNRVITRFSVQTGAA